MERGDGEDVSTPHKECHTEIRRWDRMLKELVPSSRNFSKLRKRINNKHRTGSSDTTKRVKTETGATPVTFIEIEEEEAKDLVTLYKELQLLLEKNQK